MEEYSNTATKLLIILYALAPLFIGLLIIVASAIREKRKNDFHFRRIKAMGVKYLKQIELMEARGKQRDEELKEMSEQLDKRERLEEKIRLIQSGNTAILPTGEIVPRDTHGAMNYNSPPRKETDRKKDV